MACVIGRETSGEAIEGNDRWSCGQPPETLLAGLELERDGQ